MQSYGFSSQWVKSGNLAHMSQWDFRSLQRVQQGQCPANCGQASFADTIWLFLGWLMKQSTSRLGYLEPLPRCAFGWFVSLKGCAPHTRILHFPGYLPSNCPSTRLLLSLRVHTGEQWSSSPYLVPSFKLNPLLKWKRRWKRVKKILCPT